MNPNAFKKGERITQKKADANLILDDAVLLKEYDDWFKSPTNRSSAAAGKMRKYQAVVLSRVKNREALVKADAAATAAQVKGAQRGLEFEASARSFRAFADINRKGLPPEDLAEFDETVARGEDDIRSDGKDTRAFEEVRDVISQSRKRTGAAAARDTRRGDAREERDRRRDDVQDQRDIDADRLLKTLDRSTPEKDAAARRRAENVRTGASTFDSQEDEHQQDFAKGAEPKRQRLSPNKSAEKIQARLADKIPAVDADGNPVDRVEFITQGLSGKEIIVASFSDSFSRADSARLLKAGLAKAVSEDISVGAIGRGEIDMQALAADIWDALPASERTSGMQKKIADALGVDDRGAAQEPK